MEDSLDKRYASLHSFLQSAQRASRKYKIQPLAEDINWLNYYLMSNQARWTERSEEIVKRLEMLRPNLKLTISRMRIDDKKRATKRLLSEMDHVLPNIIASWKFYDKAKSALNEVHSFMRSHVLTSVPWSNVPDKELRSFESYLSGLMLQKHIEYENIEAVEKLTYDLFEKVPHDKSNKKRRRILDDTLLNFRIIAMLS